MTISFEKFLQFLQETHSQEEYEMSILHETEMMDITLLSLAHVHTSKFYNFPDFTSYEEAICPMKRYADRLLDNSSRSFIERNSALCAKAFIFYIEECKKDGTLE